MGNVIRDKVMVLTDFSMEAGIDGMRKWSAIAQAFIFAIVYLGDCIQEMTYQFEGRKADET